MKNQFPGKILFHMGDDEVFHIFLHYHPGARLYFTGPLLLEPARLIKLTVQKRGKDHE